MGGGEVGQSLQRGLSTKGRGNSGDGCDLASTLCKYDLRKGDLSVLGWERLRRMRRGSISSELLMCGCCCMFSSTILLLFAHFNHPHLVSPRYLVLESSVLVSSWLTCPINSQVTGQWGEPYKWTGEVHPVDPFHSLDNLKNQLASVAFLYEYRSLPYPEQSCDRVARCRLNK